MNKVYVKKEYPWVGVKDHYYYPKFLRMWNNKEKVKKRLYELLNNLDADKETLELFEKLFSIWQSSGEVY